MIGTKGVGVYRVHLDDPVPDQPADPLVIRDDGLVDPLVDPTVGANAEAFVRHIAQLEQTIMELSGRCGWLQAQLEDARTQLALKSPDSDAKAHPKRLWWQFWRR